MTNSWTQNGVCTSTTSSLISTSCISSHTIYTANKRMGIQSMQQGNQICYQSDNLASVYGDIYSSANVFIGYLNLTSSSISDTYSSLNSFSQAYVRSPLATNYVYYQYGDPLIGADSSGNDIPIVFGKLDPSTGLCNSDVSPQFLIPYSTTCYTTYNANSLGPLSIQSYFYAILLGRTSNLDNSMNGTVYCNGYICGKSDYLSTGLTNLVTQVFLWEVK